MRLVEKVTVTVSRGGEPVAYVHHRGINKCNCGWEGKNWIAHMREILLSLEERENRS